MTLTTPNHGELADDWDGRLTFDLRVDNPPGDTSEIADRFDTLLLTINGTVYSLKMDELTETTVRFQVIGEEKEKLFKALSKQKAGHVIVARVTVQSPIKNNPFRQTLEFPLRISHAGRARPPLRPTFIHFEDPEYNRKLATPTAHKTTIKKAKAPDNQLYAVRLASDRREYSPDGLVTIRYDWNDEGLTIKEKGIIVVEIVRNGTPLPPLSDQAALLIEELLRPVAPQPVFQELEVLGLLRTHGNRHLMGAGGSLDLPAVDGFRPGPALGR